MKDKHADTTTQKIKLKLKPSEADGSDFIIGHFEVLIGMVIARIVCREPAIAETGSGVGQG